ncbi:MAG TPA: META domain-containing protein [Caulobacteraceae bacterium]
MRLSTLLTIAALGACSAPAAPLAPPVPPAPLARAPAIDDGSYLDQIDPMAGQWRLERIGDEDFTRWRSSVNFSGGGFINHGAGCGGGFPAFYRLDGQGLTVTRIESIQTGKCASASASERAAAVASERRLAAFLDQTVAWSRPDEHTLVLTGRDGVRAVLTRPAEPNPDIAGRWLIESIGGQPFVTERRPGTVSIGHGGIGAYGDCNSMGASEFAVTAPGRVTVNGPIISTLIGCPPEDQAEDALMARAIQGVTAYRLEGERLIFSGDPGMVLRRPPAPNRALPGKYAACGDTLRGGYHEGPITLEIGPETMRDNAGCVARYTSDGPRLSLQLDNSTACADTAPPFEPRKPVGVGGDVSTLAVARPDGFGFAEDGRLVLRTSRGLLTLCREGAPPLFGG